MSFKSSCVKMAIKMAPNFIVIWVANIILKGIAELSEFNFDIDARTAHVQFTLYGEAEPIDVWLEGFAIASENDSHHMVMHQARSNRPWLNNLLNRLIGKAWKIPAIPQFHAHIELASELFKAEDQKTESEPS